MNDQTTNKSVSERLINDHGADFFEKLKETPNTRSQIYFIKAYSMAETYKEVAELLNRENVKTLASREWTSKRVAQRASALRKKGSKLPYKSGSLDRGSSVNYDLLKAFSAQVFNG